jgi:hypothetical protein
MSRREKLEDSTEIEIAELMIMPAPVIDSAEGVVLKTMKSNIIAKTA